MSNSRNPLLDMLDGGIIFDKKAEEIGVACALAEKAIMELVQNYARNKKRLQGTSFTGNIGSYDESIAKDGTVMPGVIIRLQIIVDKPTLAALNHDRDKQEIEQTVYVPGDFLSSVMVSDIDSGCDCEGCQNNRIHRAEMREENRAPEMQEVKKALGAHKAFRGKGGEA